MVSRKSVSLVKFSRVVKISSAVTSAISIPDFSTFPNIVLSSLAILSYSGVVNKSPYTALSSDLRAFTEISLEIPYSLRERSNLPASHLAIFVNLPRRL